MESVRDYHSRTKHRLDGYARGPESIDWDAQPKAFRVYEGSPLIELPLAENLGATGYSSLFCRETISPQAVSLTSLGSLLRHALAVSAWKQLGDARWALRCNPSSGNLHPTEAYVFLKHVPELKDGLYHYRPDLHALELRWEFPRNNASWQRPQIVLGLSSIPWRELWKYGERGYRYCQHDLGHAIAAVDFSAANLGWKTSLCQGLPRHERQALLGFNREHEFHFCKDEREEAELFMELSYGTASQESDDPAVEKTHYQTGSWIKPCLASLNNGVWYGKANRLDDYHYYRWPLVDSIYSALNNQASKHDPDGAQTNPYDQNIAPPLIPVTDRTFVDIAQQRRSGQAYDASGELPLAVFYQMLDHLIPRAEVPPWNTLPWKPRLHLVLFVHRVKNLAPGLYFMPRTPAAEQSLKNQLRPEFQWQTIDACPEHLPLKILIKARSGKTIAKLSCMQAIAADACFSLGMLAEFDSQLAASENRYPELFWEAGAMGQCLYLDAEAAGFRGTGIGCYFDDAVHELLGIQGTDLQSLYHFSVGKALVDARISTLPAYNR